MKNQQQLSKFRRILLLWLASVLVFLPKLASAQTPSLIASCAPPLESELLGEDARPIERGVITADTISQTGITTPSLWWAEEQYDPFEGKLIDNWIAYPNERRIDLVVNRQLWTLLDYLKRYSFVNQLGTVARGYQYNLRVFNQQKQCLAIYTCNFSTAPDQCEIDFDPSGRDGFQMEPPRELGIGNGDQSQ